VVEPELVQAMARKMVLEKTASDCHAADTHVAKNGGTPPMKSRTRTAGTLFLMFFISLASPLNCQSKSADAAATVTKLIHDDVKASLAGDTNFIKNNYVDGYIEGTSLGTWMTKEQFLDTSSNKVNSRKISDLKVDIFGDTAIARFRQTYDALVEGKQRTRTTICTETWITQAEAWKLVASHCSRVQ
jgi:hypothetical protein